MFLNGVTFKSATKQSQTEARFNKGSHYTSHYDANAAFTYRAKLRHDYEPSSISVAICLEWLNN